MANSAFFPWFSAVAAWTVGQLWYNSMMPGPVLFTAQMIVRFIFLIMIGCLITAIKNSLYTISFNFSEASHLSLLLKTKLHILREFSEDFVKKINPYNTKINDFVKRENFEL